MISIKNLYYRAGGKELLTDISLDIPDNDYMAIIGPNGAGKSTLIKILLGILPDYSGQITIDGLPHDSWLKNNMVGYVPQSEKYDKRFPATALEIVMMGLASQRGPFRSFTQSDFQKAESAMKELNAIHFKDSLIGELSGGEFQRVILARALVSDPKYLFFDEPEAAIDEEGVSELYNLLTKLHDSGKTILLISHDVSFVSHQCKSIVCLNRTLHCHTPPELLNAEILKKTYGDALQLIERKHHT